MVSSMLRKASVPAIAVSALFLSSCLDPTAPNQSSTDAGRNEMAYGFSVSGGVYTIVSVNSGKCLDVAGASTLSGANIQQWTCHNSSNQQWKLTSVGTGVFEVKSMNSSKCADVYQAGTADGANIQQWTCNGQSNQKWKAVDMGSGQYELVAQNSNKCMDVAGVSLSDGANVHQWTCKGNANQKWKLVPVSSSTPTPPPPTSGGTWAKANLTNFTSYPDPGSDECLNYNGCTWAGQFAALPNKMPESWVQSHNIIAVHEKFFSKYKLKTLRLTQGTHQIDAVVYDECADSDCNGCCTKNMAQTGFLIDIEKYTMKRFGSGDGVVSWECLNCN